MRDNLRLYCFLTGEFLSKSNKREKERENEEEKKSCKTQIGEMERFSKNRQKKVKIKG